jgi:hypothetical protein
MSGEYRGNPAHLVGETDCAILRILECRRAALRAEVEAKAAHLGTLNLALTCIEESETTP